MTTVSPVHFALKSVNYDNIMNKLKENGLFVEGDFEVKRSCTLKIVYVLR